MSKYTITIEGDFEKGECWKCPWGDNSSLDAVMLCVAMFGCPLEEVPDTNVGEIRQGEWMVINAEGDSIEVITAQCNDMRGGKE